MLKKLFLCSLILFSIKTVNAQWAWVDENFDGYAGTVSTVPPDLFISWNSASPASFYTSAGNFGLTAPSYKFGNDSDYIVTKNVPYIDSISCWVKGNGGPFAVQNELRFYYSSDSITYTLFYSMDSLPTSGTAITFPCNQVSGNIKIEYYKYPGGGNLAFDDLKIYSNVIIGVDEKKLPEVISVFPSPTDGIVNIRTTVPGIPAIEIYDIIGNKVFAGTGEVKNPRWYTVDLSDENKGFYFIKVWLNGEYFTKRITVVD